MDLSAVRMSQEDECRSVGEGLRDGRFGAHPAVEAFCFMAAMKVWPAPTPRVVVAAGSTPFFLNRYWVRKSVEEPVSVIPRTGR